MELSGIHFRNGEGPNASIVEAPLSSHSSNMMGTDALNI